ncbi:proline-rich protein 2-like [Heterocephalus glaber]|uniref:Proline-rich protein 2-like n=1 Tax=Heterocephalus glaber TaxID=10181 RepID=A0AAX6SJ93_HETGA|nr:proline-rich protein 2-like [Heterocephalus glaber]
MSLGTTLSALWTWASHPEPLEPDRDRSPGQAEGQPGPRSPEPKLLDAGRQPEVIQGELAIPWLERPAFAATSPQRAVPQERRPRTALFSGRAKWATSLRRRLPGRPGAAHRLSSSAQANLAASPPPRLPTSPPPRLPAAPAARLPLGPPPAKDLHRDRHACPNRRGSFPGAAGRAAPPPRAPPPPPPPPLRNRRGRPGLGGARGAREAAPEHPVGQAEVGPRRT